jgi:hypothetical protein
MYSQRFDGSADSKSRDRLNHTAEIIFFFIVSWFYCILVTVTIPFTLSVEVLNTILNLMLRFTMV